MAAIVSASAVAAMRGPRRMPSASFSSSPTLTGAPNAVPSSEAVA
jgi:hypothetical protein